MANQDIAMNLKVKPTQGSRAMKLKLMMGVLVLCFGARSFADTLCTSNEQAIFSCTLANHKTASLCAPKDLKAPGLYLQYRFGTHQKIELTYPDKVENWLHRFYQGNFRGDDGRHGLYVKFANGSYDYFLYILYNDDVADDNEQDGIAVYQQDKLVRRIKCHGLAEQEFRSYAQSDPSSDPFEMPDDLNWAGVPGEAVILSQKAESKYYAIPSPDPYKIFSADSVVADPRGFLWVSSGDFISKLMPDGNVEVYAGKPYSKPRENTGYRDGNSKNALFGNITDTVVGKNGNIYVMDAFNGVIRKIGLDSYVTTFAAMHRT